MGKIPLDLRDPIILKTIYLYFYGEHIEHDEAIRKYYYFIKNKKGDEKL